IPAGTFAGAGFTSISLPSGAGLVIGETAFAGSALESVSLGGNIAGVGAGAFSGCPELKSATIGATRLEMHAFANSPKLASVSLTGLTSVPATAFALCKELAEVSGTESLTAIGDQAFAGCTALENFSFGPALKSIGTGAFESTGLKMANMQGCKALSTIGARAFSNDASLESASLPEGLSELGEGSFFNCPTLTEVSLPEDMTEIPAYAFKGDAALNISDVLHDGVATVGNYALKDMTGVKDVIIPESLEYLGDGAMEGMTGLEKLNVHQVTSVPELGKNVWKGIDQSEVELHVLSTMSEDFADADQWRDFKFMISTGINTIENPSGADGAGIEGRFHGSELQLRSRGTDIEKVDLYQTSGALALSATPRSTEANIATEGVQGHIFVVECTLSNGSRAALKLVRR
ncbi:MAG: leucine-rich repeat domain-containing protein, partial [Muribaculaceae bacterium]|nr:leucine-rich repeat domain-containing protein [Muribaculaceae bacterium]